MLYLASNTNQVKGLPNICEDCGGVADPQCVDADGQHLPLCLRCEKLREYVDPEADFIMNGGIFAGDETND